MFCKHCGKEIADDSKFCQHCGGKQDTSITLEATNNTESERGEVVNKVELKHTFEKRHTALFSKKSQKYWLIYAIWVFINIIIWNMGSSYVEHDFFDERNGKPSAYLYPLRHCIYYDFNYSKNKTYKSFDPSTYDITEFILYVLILPLVIIIYFKYLHEPFKKMINDDYYVRNESDNHLKKEH